MMNLASTSDVLRIVTGTPRDAILAAAKASCAWSAMRPSSRAGKPCHRRCSAKRCIGGITEHEEST